MRLDSQGKMQKIQRCRRERVGRRSLTFLLDFERRAGRPAELKPFERREEAAPELRLERARRRGGFTCD